MPKILLYFSFGAGSENSSEVDSLGKPSKMFRYPLVEVHSNII